MFTKTTIAAVIGSGLALVVGGLGSAQAAGLIGSNQIKDGGVHKVDLAGNLQDRLARGGAEGHTVYVTKFGSIVAPRKTGDGDAGSLSLTGEGAVFGPFADGGSCDAGGFARLNFNGLNGKRLSAIHQLDYEGMTLADTDTGGVGSLTMRIYLNGGADRLTFSPNTQYNKTFDSAYAQGEVHSWLTTLGTWRLNDDAGSDPAGELPFSHWASPSVNGNDPIDHIDILLGCQNGVNLQGVVRSIRANGTDYQLGRIG